ncbi:hypothetical protein [Enterococcus villorum]|uniref:hypothetical protein n=1 Tax=Enterococcus villorum TaxID=112904 RepID=UPI0009BD04F2|nr:hypothetical protein [Enterococcus villorum]OQO72657.1 hypothetical protein BH744_11320 [Enterococcus villorum]
MELLEKETFYHRINRQIIEPIHGAFFKEEQYQGYASHQEAVLAFLTYMNRVWSIGIPHLVPGLKEKLDQVPRVEVTLSPEVEARIEAGATAQVEADRKAEIKYLKDRKRHVDYEKLQKRFEESKQELTKIRKEVRKDREAALKEMPQLYELTNEVALVYTKDTSFEAYTGFPIRLNPEMMQGTEVASEDFFAENGEYELAFRSYLQVHRTKEDFQRVNQLLFPEKKELVIYQWNTDFTNSYNGGRKDDGAYLWSIYDRKKQQFIVIDIELIIP